MKGKKEKKPYDMHKRNTPMTMKVFRKAHRTRIIDPITGTSTYPRSG